MKLFFLWKKISVILHLPCLLTALCKNQMFMSVFVHLTWLSTIPILIVVNFILMAIHCSICMRILPQVNYNIYSSRIFGLLQSWAIKNRATKDIPVHVVWWTFIYRILLGHILKTGKAKPLDAHILSFSRFSTLFHNHCFSIAVHKTPVCSTSGPIFQNFGLFHFPP